MPQRSSALVKTFAAVLMWSAVVLPAATANRPNVLFIVVDDLRPTLGCFGDSQAKSPNIDRLAARGTAFTRAFCQQALCAPSRASVLTGLRPDSAGITDLSHPVRKTLPDVRTLPQHFRENGYTTISLGKIYHHQSDDNGIGWSQPAWEPPGLWEFAAADPANGVLAPGGRTTAWECADVADDFYPDGKVATRAVTELGQLKAAGKPFFLAVGIHKPHLPFFAPKKYWDMYQRDSLRLPTQLAWPDQAPALATTDSSELRQYRNIPKSGLMPEDIARTLIHGYYAATSYADAMIGRVLDALDREGLRDNTVVVLWGDHGWKLGEYGAWCKHTNMEIDTRAPLVVSAPGRRGAGSPSAALVEFVDLYPTLSNLCGLPVPTHCEGTSFVPLLDSPKREWKAGAFSQYPRGRNIMGYTVRDARWRYTEWIDSTSGTVTARELYDHENNAIVDRNLASASQYQEQVTRLAALLDHGKGWRHAQPVSNASAQP